MRESFPLKSCGADALDALSLTLLLEFDVDVIFDFNHELLPRRARSSAPGRGVWRPEHARASARDRAGPTWYQTAPFQLGAGQQDFVVPARRRESGR